MKYYFKYWLLVHKYKELENKYNELKELVDKEFWWPDNEIVRAELSNE